MIHSENAQQNAFQNPQQTASLHQLVQSLQSLLQNQQGQQSGFGQGGIGQGGYGQGAFGQGMGQGAYGQGSGQGGQNWGSQRQLSQQDVSNVLQQIAPILPQIVAQAQQQQYQQPLAAFGGGYGQQRSLSQQDVSEVVRQILPIVPQLLQSMQQQTHGQTGGGQQGFGQQGSGQHGGWQGQPAFGFGQQHNPWQQTQHQRQLSPQDVNEIVQQLTQVIPLAFGAQQRM
jgi:hypothetical protein